ncbi:MAG: SH3 domain-containing protein, partial [Alphaproteobacteria bacterium]|nr:SH3 domain-containing protein [Alphaproteobacteria bacterium]
RKRPTARERAYREQRNWKPRASWLIALVIAGLLGVAVLHPEVRPLVVEHATQAYTSVKQRIDALVAPKPAAAKPEASKPADTPIPLPSLEGIPDTISGRVIIAVGSANVRAGPSSDAAVIKSLPRGSSASVLGSDKGWQLIRFGDGPDDVGWVYGDLLSAPPIGEPTQ